jgi:hypothetical protein
MEDVWSLTISRDFSHLLVTGKTECDWMVVTSVRVVSQSAAFFSVEGFLDGCGNAN